MKSYQHLLTNNLRLSKIVGFEQMSNYFYDKKINYFCKKAPSRLLTMQRNVVLKILFINFVKFLFYIRRCKKIIYYKKNFSRRGIKFI